MSKVIIVGGGIAGLSAGVFLQKAGHQAEIYEKNGIVGGLCIGWKRDGYMIDNCIHWLTGAKEGTSLYNVWREIGALGDGIELHKKDMFFCSEDKGERVIFWRDIERTRRELIALSPEDEAEINKLLDNTKLASGLSVPTEKPFDLMTPIDYIKLGMSMKGMTSVMRAYDKMNVVDLASRFRHPLIRKAITDYLPKYYQAFSFIVSYATIASGNGDVPYGGSLAMSERIADRFKKLGGIIHLNAPVSKVLVDGNRARGIQLADGSEVAADYVICACDTSFTFGSLLDEKYMSSGLKKLYNMRKSYPLMSGFQVALAIDGNYEELQGTRFFPIEELCIAHSKAYRMSTASYDYDASFAPKGKGVLQSNFAQTEEDFSYWKALYEDKEAYRAEKERLGKEILVRILRQYPFLKDKARILDIWTPATYERYCNSFCGAYMSFIVTKNSKSITVPGKLKGLKNVFIASQWQMGPGGLPTAATMGKFAAYRVKD